MSKHYNLTVTDDNGKSVTTSNTSTEHPDEVLRMMQLAGMQSEPQCGMESVEENEYQPTPKNDKLDLDDYSKKSPESISKQPKKLQPSRGDNPLEYSLDENEIYESLINEMDSDCGCGPDCECEGNCGPDCGCGPECNESVQEGKLPPGLQAYQDKKKGKKSDKEEDKVEEKAKPDFADIDKDGDKKETMKKAAKDKKEKTNESESTRLTDLARLKHLSGMGSANELLHEYKADKVEKVDEIIPALPVVGAIAGAAVKGVAKLAGKAVKKGAKAVAGMANQHNSQ